MSFAMSRMSYRLNRLTAPRRIRASRLVVGRRWKSQGVSVILTGRESAGPRNEEDEEKRSLGRLGDVVTVKAGFARNYLIPQKMAVYDTEFNRLKYTMMAEEMKERERREAERIEKNEEADVSARLEEERALRVLFETNTQTLVFSRDANEEGVLYGSVRKSEVASELSKMLRQEMVEQQIEFAGEDEADNLKTIGQHEITVCTTDGKPISTMSVRVENSST